MIEMNSQLIIIVQVLIAVAFAFWIFSRRGGMPKPTVLKMTSDLEGNPQAKPQVKRYQSVSFTDHGEVKAKVLNVIFMWNGHSWDAYEVFGLPAGSPIERVHEKFNELKSKSDDGQKMFLTEALKAIETKTSAS